MTKEFENNDTAVKELREKARDVGQKMLEAVSNEDEGVVLFSTISVLSFLICMGNENMRERESLIDAITMQLKEMSRIDNMIFGDGEKSGKGH
jgi:hypothetical protein